MIVFLVWGPQGPNVPDVVDGVCFTQVAAGNEHTMSLRSDGSAVVCGSNLFGQCDLPGMVVGAFFFSPR